MAVGFFAAAVASAYFGRIGISPESDGERTEI
jgi:hypothetical protein